MATLPLHGESDNPLQYAFNFDTLNSHPYEDPVYEVRPRSHKRCQRCHRWFPLDKFHFDNGKRDGLNKWCKECVNKHRKEKVPIEKQRAYDLHKAYGITKKQYDQMLEAQGDVCYICKGEEQSFDTRSGELRALSVDHDHATGEIRKLLCHRCNCALGWANEEPERLRAIADYAEWCKTVKPSGNIVQINLIE